MSWFNTSGFSSLAKSAISQAQKSIDKVLDIKEENEHGEKQQKQQRRNDLKGVSKSKSYTEASSVSGGTRSGMLKDGRKKSPEEQNLEEDSFFASFLGGNKQSTPKSEKKPSEKLESTRVSLPDEDKRQPDKKASKLHSRSTDSFLDHDRLQENDVESKQQEIDEKDFIDISENQEKDNGSLDAPPVDFVSDAIEDESLSAISDREKNSNNENSIINKEKSSTADILDDKIKDLQKNEHDESSKTSIEINDNKLEQDSIDTAEIEPKPLQVSHKESDNIDTEESMDGDKDIKTNGSPDVVYAELESLDSDMNETISAEYLPSEQLEKVCENKELQNEKLHSREGSIDEELSLELEQIGENVIFDAEKQDIEDNSMMLVDVDNNEETCNNMRYAEDNEIIETEKDNKCVMEAKNQTNATVGEEEELSIDNGGSLNDDEDSSKICKEDTNCSEEVSVRENISHSRDSKLHETQSDASGEIDTLKSENSSIEDGINFAEDDKKSEREEDVGSLRVMHLEQEVKRLEEVVDARESKMVTLSKENIDLQEAVSILRNQLEQAEQANYGDDAMLVEMRDEFSKRIGEISNKLSKVTKEKDQLQLDLDETTERLTKESEQLVHDFRATLEEKEEQIAGLLAEGEALSKKELKSNNAVKKLRAKVKDLEGKAEKNQKENDEKEKELTNLKETLKEKTEQEKTLRDQLKKLEMITDQQEDEISKLKDQLDDADDKMKGMQTTLDSGYQEINRLSLEKANRDSEIEEITLLKGAKDELEKGIVEIENKAKLARLEDQHQLESLRLTITRTEQAAARREDNLQLEIKDLHQRLEEAESRNQELSQSIASASRPLLRQIENLQGSHHNQALNWEKIEKNLNERLASAQHQLALVSEKERRATDFAMEMKSRVAALEMQIKTLRQEKEHLNDAVNESTERSRILEENFNREKTKFEDFYANHRKVLEEVQNEKIFIENQLNAERVKQETELQRILTENKAKAQLSRQNSSNAPNAMAVESKKADDTESDGPSVMARSRTSSSSSSSNIIDAGCRNASTAIMEKLQTQMRQKDGELKLLREEIDHLQKTRASLAQELVDLSNFVEDLQEKIKDYDSMKEDYQAVESRYNAALQMYGEKAEEADELKMDLEDIKQMYKQQIQQLIGER